MKKHIEIPPVKEQKIQKIKFRYIFLTFVIVILLLHFGIHKMLPDNPSYNDPYYDEEIGREIYCGYGEPIRVVCPLCKKIIMVVP